MVLQKLPRMLQIISERLQNERIPYALIGALALSAYGLPKYTAHMDILIRGEAWPEISSLMEDLGYSCFQKTRSFAQFDSESGVYGSVDFMLVNTDDGREILQRSVVAKDDLLGAHPVVQPTDYIVLKLMAIANNPDRASKDQGDILDLLRLCDRGLIPEVFEEPDRKRICRFADRFGQRKRMKSLYSKASNREGGAVCFEI